MSVYIIAEAGVNHNGSSRKAFELVDAALAAGADAVKFQTFTADSLVRKGARKAAYQQSETGEGDQYSMLKELELGHDLHRDLIKYCDGIGIEFISTGFDENSVNFLVELGVRRLKVPSGELTNLPYLRHVADKNLPTILSTGMGTLEEVGEAVKVFQEAKPKGGVTDPLPQRLTILHCTSNYPTALLDVNLLAMQTMAENFGLPVGYSDHTSGILIPPVAVAMGASVIEKHFTLDRTLPGPDHKASLEPDQLTQMITDIRDVEKALGDGVKRPTSDEIEVRSVVRRSIFVVEDLPAGTVLKEEHLIMLRPEGGIPPKDLEQVLGRRLRVACVKGEMISWSQLGE